MTPPVPPSPAPHTWLARVTGHRRAMTIGILLLALLGVFADTKMNDPCLNEVVSSREDLTWRQKRAARLQFAGSAQEARAVIADWNRNCRGLVPARTTIEWDFALIVSYVGILTLLTLLAAGTSRSALMNVLGRIVVGLTVLAGLLDVIENVAMLALLRGVTWGFLPEVARICASAKLGFIGGAVVYLLAVVVQRLMQRRGESSDAYPPAPGTAPAYDSRPDGATSLPGGAGSEATTIDAVLGRELAYLTHHRHQGKNTAVVEQTLVGLALSGGGIRSATTNLGILQGLAELRVLPFVDYLCTVSGGGYIGSCLSTLLSMKHPLPAETSIEPDRDAHLFGSGAVPAFRTDWEAFPFRDDFVGDAARRANALLGHLRTHGNFMMARSGFLRRDALRAMGSIVSGVVYNVSGFVMILLIATSLYLTFAELLAPDIARWLGPVPVSAIYEAPISGPPSIAGDTTTTRRWTTGCTSVNGTCETQVVASLHSPTLAPWVARNLERVADPVVSIFRDARPRGMAIRKLAIGSVVSGMLSAVFALLLVWLLARLYTQNDLPDPAIGEANEEAYERILLVSLAMLTFAWIVITTTTFHFWLPPGEEELVLLWVPAFMLLGARFANIAIGILVQRSRNWGRRFRSQWAAYQAITIYGLWGAAGFILMAPFIYALAGNRFGASLGALGALAAARLLTPARSSGSHRLTKLPTGLRHFLLAVAVFLVVVVGIMALGSILVSLPATGNFALVAILAVITLLILGVVVDQNKLSLHYFYRDRLAETYLLSELPDRKHRLWTFRSAIDMPLHQLHGDFASDAPNGRNPAPYHLISTAINLAGSRDLTRKDRKSGYFLFSKLYCGSTHTGFRPTAIYSRGKTEVARAVAISGAAASSAIGYMTFFAQSFATVLFNVRLGYWLENPRYARSASRAERGIFWPGYLLREVAMNTTENSELVNLSDGGHTGDNLGIYPLFQRRCKVIIACDAEQDGSLSFGSLTEVLRQAYIDLGISVDIDLSMIRPDPVTGRSRNHRAVGRICYPDRPGQASYLIYLKNSLTGDEPEPVLNYKVSAPAFPHESTADLFFSDAQFESYRALGVHIAKSAFTSWAGSAAFLDAMRGHGPVPMSQ